MRRSMVSFTVLLLLVTFMATGCATTTNSDQPDEESVPTIASTTTTSAATQTTSTSDQGTEARTIELDVSDPPVYDNGAGVTLRINDVRVGDLTSVPDDIAEELSFGLDDLNSRAFLIMTITVRNDSTAPVGFFPDQGTALVGSRQVEANSGSLNLSLGGAARSSMERQSPRTYTSRSRTWLMMSLPLGRPASRWTDPSTRTLLKVSARTSISLCPGASSGSGRSPTEPPELSIDLRRGCGLGSGPG